MRTSVTCINQAFHSTLACLHIVHARFRAGTGYPHSSTQRQRCSTEYQARKSQVSKPTVRCEPRLALDNIHCLTVVRPSRWLPVTLIFCDLQLTKITKICFLTQQLTGESVRQPSCAKTRFFLEPVLDQSGIWFLAMHETLEVYDNKSRFSVVLTPEQQS